jgi:cytochrome b pre-mRNA-processing protein 3
MILARWRARGARRDRAHALYTALVEQARSPGFYRDLAVPDTVDGRFDMIVLHCFLVLRRLRAAGDEGNALGQTVFEVMFADMDQNLRQMGVGDLGVGRRVKAMTQAFMGRVAAYEKAMGEGTDALVATIARNVYRVEPDGAPAGAAILATYAVACDRALGAQDAAAVMEGRPRFPAPLAP